MKNMLATMCKLLSCKENKISCLHIHFVKKQANFLCYLGRAAPVGNKKLFKSLPMI